MLQVTSSSLSTKKMKIIVLLVVLSLVLSVLTIVLALNNREQAGLINKKQEQIEKEVRGRVVVEKEKMNQSLQIDHVNVQVKEIFRNVDSFSSDQLRVYFMVNYNKREDRVPKQGYLEVQSLEKKIIDYSFSIDKKMRGKAGAIVLYDDSNRVLGQIVFTLEKSLFMLYSVLGCHSYTYRLENIYPHSQHPTYIERGSQRFKCVGDGKHYLEIRLVKGVRRRGYLNK